MSYILQIRQDNTYHSYPPRRWSCCQPHVLCTCPTEMAEYCLKRFNFKISYYNKTAASNWRTRNATPTYQKPVYTSLVQHRTTSCRQHASQHCFRRPLHPRHFPSQWKTVAWQLPPVAILTNPNPGYNVNGTLDSHEILENMTEKLGEKSIILVAKKNSLNQQFSTT